MLLSPVLCATSEVPSGWEKVSGLPETTTCSGFADGLAPAGDRQNSYAWSMEVLGDHLYVGTNRNVFTLMVQQVPWGNSLVDWTNSGAKPVPMPTDMRARIYRMSLIDGSWEFVYTPPPFPGGVTLPQDEVKGRSAAVRSQETPRAC